MTNKKVGELVILSGLLFSSVWPILGPSYHTLLDPNNQFEAASIPTYRAVSDK